MICKACKSEIPNGAKICPHCRTKQNGNLSCSGMLGAFVFIIFAFFLLSVFSGDDEPETRPTSTTSTTASTNTISSSTTAPEGTPETSSYPTMNGFLIGDKSGTTYDGYCEVKGVIGNATGRDCSYVQITIGFYNKNDVKIDSGIDNVLNLGAGETWQYEVMGLGDNIVTFKIEDITWY